MKKTKKLLILVIAVIFCTSCGMFGLSDSAWSEVFEKRNSMPQNSLEEKLKNPEMVYQTVDGKLYFREGGKIDVYEKNSTEKEKITSDVVSYLVYNGKIYYTTTYQMTGKMNCVYVIWTVPMMKDLRRVLSPFVYKMEMMGNWFQLIK